MSIGQEHYASAPVGRFAPASVAVRAPAERQQKTGLAVYRDNVIVALVNALAARYPVVRRMAGDESFRAAAHRFVMAELPRSLALLHYGETFPRFLRSLGRDASFDILRISPSSRWPERRPIAPQPAARSERSRFRRSRWIGSAPCG